MLLLTDIDLRTDPGARAYRKEEMVQVIFAETAGTLMSLEGANRYDPGDALITAASGASWVVSRDRFDARYAPLDASGARANGRFQNRPVTVLAKQIDAPFSIRRSAGGDLLEGKAGDWLLQYAPNDYGLARQDRFAAVYRVLTDAPVSPVKR